MTRIWMRPCNAILNSNGFCSRAWTNKPPSRLRVRLWLQLWESCNECDITACHAQRPGSRCPRRGRSTTCRRTPERTPGRCTAESLQRYRLEYAERLQQAMRDGIDPASMHNYQQFLASLDAALQRARQALDAQQQRVQQSQQQWRQEQQRLTAFDTLLTRRDAERQRHEARREQRISDEMSANRLLRQRTAHAEAGRKSS